MASKSVVMKAGFSAFNFYFVGIKERHCFQSEWIVSHFQELNNRSSEVDSLGGSVTF